MPWPFGYIALHSPVVPSHSRQNTPGHRSLSRRKVIITLGLIPHFMSARATAQHLPTDPKGTEVILRERCYHYVSLIHPVRQDALLWRGAEPGGKVVIRSPTSDLLMDETYGAEGASYFRDLDRFLRDQMDNIVLPSRAHIATGDRRVAMNWGTPVSIWPVGPFRYAYWRDSSLIYEDGETLVQSKRRGGELVFNQGLRDALVHGKEVMFEAQAFFELNEELTSDVLALFR